jgi:hypothetical protein
MRVFGQQGSAAVLHLLHILPEPRLLHAAAGLSSYTGVHVPAVRGLASSYFASVALLRPDKYTT